MMCPEELFHLVRGWPPGHTSVRERVTITSVLKPFARRDADLLDLGRLLCRLWTKAYNAMVLSVYDVPPSA
jgi:hypothetical protein